MSVYSGGRKKKYPKAKRKKKLRTCSGALFRYVGGRIAGGWKKEWKRVAANKQLEAVVA